MSELELKPEEKKGPIAWMAGHSVASNLLMLLCLVGGFVALRNIKQEVFPDIERDSVIISIPYPGASPEDVESGTLLVVEEAVRGLEGVDEINSVAREGSGTVTVDLLLGEDAQQMAQDIKSEVDRITSFPEDAEDPEVKVADRKREVLNIMLYGDANRSVLHQLAEQARDQLLSHPDITQVEISGLPDLEISIEISQENLRRYNLTPQEVAARISRASVDVAGGSLKTDNGEILVRVKERRDYGEQFAKLPIITNADGAQVLLGQIATITDGFEDTDEYTLYNGKPAVTLEVYRVGDQTPISVSDAVHEQIDEVRADLPPGITTTIERDRSDYYRQRVQLLLKNGGIGICLVFILLGIFLESRLAFWVMMGLPISFLGAFLILPSTGITINMISLFAFIIALGIVVDDAIVVGENVYHYHQEGIPFLQAAIRGAREVAMPVTFSILTNIVTFMPIYFIPGTMGKIFKMIPIVVCTVFLISLVESLFVLPAHLGHHGAKQRHGISLWIHRRQQAFSHGFRRWVQNGYGPVLEYSVKHRYVTIGLSIFILLVVLTYAISGRMGMELFPKVESDFAMASVILPYGSPVEKTEVIMQRLLESAQKVIDDSERPELVTSITSDIGVGGSHVGRMRVSLADAKIRKDIMSTEEFTNRWRQNVGEIAGVDNMRFRSDSGGPGGRGRPVTVELSHRNIDILEHVATELAEDLETYPRVSDVDDGYQLGKEQFDFLMKPEGKSLGLTAFDVARQVRSAFYGAEAIRQQRGRNEIRVMVRLPEYERSTEQTIGSFMIRTPAGSWVPLREVAEIKRGRSYTTIDRRNGRRVVQVQADVTPQSAANEILADLGQNSLPVLMRKYPGLSFSFEGHQADMRESMGSLKTSFLVALLVIYAMLAIPFRSYAQPLIVMVSIPFGVVGAILGHLIMGYSLSILSLFGIVALSGVVVNDSLVMIDFANRRRRNLGYTPHDAITSAGIQRFRPIMLTTLTTFGGLAPMIFETSRQARFLIPMALSLGYGILFATFITLFIVPSLYMAIEDGVKLLRAFRFFLFARPGAAIKSEEKEKAPELAARQGLEAEEMSG
ncbi:MAG: efflux RND transporter permease subunit [Candidatus Sumerlaeia bacterium]